MVLLPEGCICPSLTFMSSIQQEFLELATPPVDALSHFAESDAESRGAIHTRVEVAEFILDLVGWTEQVDAGSARLLEPSAGEGDFVVPAARRALARLRPGEIDRAAGLLKAVEVNTASLEICRARLQEVFREFGWGTAATGEVLDQWLVQADFLTTPLAGDFTHIVGNPPYIRLEALPKELLKLYRSRWRSLYDRADLYVAFIERSLGLLAPQGRLGFICADRWMKNRYGRVLRGMVADAYHLDAYIDFTDCPAFESEVNAYPAVTIIRRGPGKQTRVAFRPEVDRGHLQELADAVATGRDHPDVAEMENVVVGEHPWIFESAGLMAVIRKIERRFPLMEEVGCRVGIGVATGNDSVFIGSEAELSVEAERRMPMVSTRDIRSGKVVWSGQWVLNPFESDGSLADLDQYPKFRDYLEKHRAVIMGRNVARKNPRGWYRTIDRIHEPLLHKPKLLIPDIKGEAHVVYEDGKLYPHHNLYYVVSDVWDLHALRAILASPVARGFVAAYSPRMRGGFLRFQAQYLRRIRLPRWDSLSATTRAALKKCAKEANTETRDELVRGIFELTKEEWNLLTNQNAAPA